MARTTLKNVYAATRYMFQQRFGVDVGPAQDHDFDNNKPLTWSDTLDLASLEALRVDADGRIQVDMSAVLGQREPMVFNLVANAALATQTFFIARRAMVITSLSEVHATLGTDAGAVTMQVFKDTGTSAPGGGATVQVGSFNLKAAINTPQNATLLTVKADGTFNTGIQLAIGDRLSAVFTGVLTALAGVQLTAMAAPGAKEQVAGYAMNANGSIANAEFFTANRPMQIVGVQGIWSAKGTDAGTVSLDIQKDTGTQAVTAGTTILAAVINAKGAANTVVTPALSATASVLNMAAGDRLAFVLTGTPTALAGLVLLVYFAPTYGRIELTYNMQANANIATTSIFTADRDYEFLEGSVTQGTAGSDGGAVTADFFIDRGTNAPGAGATCTAGTANLKATAETPQFLTPATALHNRLLATGDRLTVKVVGVTTSLAGVVAVGSLAPR